MSIFTIEILIDAEVFIENSCSTVVPRHCYRFEKVEKEQRSYKEPKAKEVQRRIEVIDWCQRNLVNVQVIDDQSKHKLPEGIPPSCNYIFVLTFIQNQQKKQMTYILSASSE